jgi:hypothetical protein
MTDGCCCVQRLVHGLHAIQSSSQDHDFPNNPCALFIIRHVLIELQGWNACHDSVMVKSLWQRQMDAMVCGILSMDCTPCKVHHMIVISSTTCVHSSSFHRHWQSGKARRCDAPLSWRNCCSGDGWVQWCVVAAITRGTTGTCTCFRVIRGDKLHPVICLIIAPRASGKESLGTLARELAMESASN